MTVDMGKHFSMGALLKFTGPTIAMMLFLSLYEIVDGVFVSNCIGKTALAAINIIFPAVMLLASVGMMIGTGGSAIVAKTLGEGLPKLANDYFAVLVEFAIVLGLVLGAVGFVFIDPICQVLGAEGDMLTMTIEYGGILMLALPAYVLQFTFQSFFVAAGKPQLGFFMMLVAGLLNVGLDALFIIPFGWGIPGAALATAIAQIVAACFPLIYFSRKNSSALRLRLTPPNFRLIGKACVNGSSEMVSSIAMNVVTVLYNLSLLYYYGEDGVAAYSVIGYTMMVFIGIFIGYSQGVAPLMSFQYGAKNHTEMVSLFRKSLMFIVGSSVVMFVIAQVGAPFLSAMFVSYDAQLLELTINAYRIYAMAFLLMGYSIYGSAFFTSLNNGLVSAVISFLRTLVFEVSAIIVLPLLFGPMGIWYSVTVAELASVLVTASFMVGLRKRYGYTPASARALDAADAADAVAEAVNTASPSDEARV